MTELLTAAQMREIEQRAMASGEVSGLELMERAGAAVVAAIADEWPDLGSGSGATVLCGPGNNGGDGFVIARLLLLAGWRVRVLVVPTLKRSPDALDMLKRFRAVGGRARRFSYKTFRHGSLKGPRSFCDGEGPFDDLFVDAVLGTGARGPMRGDVGKALALMAGHHGDYEFFRARTVCVDLPSGLDSDSGEIPGCPRSQSRPISRQNVIPNARLTVSFDSPKLGHVLGQGPEVCGKVVVADIGVGRWRSLDPQTNALRPPRTRLIRSPISASAKKDVLSDIWSVPDLRDTSFDRRLMFSKSLGHKYNYGHTLVFAGGLGRTGAARLAARAALRAGSGLVTVAAPKDAIPECAAQLTAIMLRQCDDVGDVAALLDDKRFTALCVGPGLGVGEETQNLVSTVLNARRWTVLDADALTSFQDDPGTLFAQLHDKVVLTPHDGEFARLFPDLASRMRGPKPSAEMPNLPTNNRNKHAESRSDDESAMLERRTSLEQDQAPLYSRVDAALEAAERAGCTVLLKGPATIIANPRGQAAVSLAAYDRAAPWLATAGSGDVLAGMIAGLMAKGTGELSAETAAWLHVECARSFGPGLIAEDLPEELPNVFRAHGMQEPNS